MIYRAKFSHYNRIMVNHSEIIRIQGFLRESARAIYDSLPVPPFTLFFHPSDSFKYFNYAIPDVACGGDLSVVLQTVRNAFQQRGRTARLEFFEAFAPDLPAALRASGFGEEARQWSMLCTLSSFRPVSPVDGVTATVLGPAPRWEDVRNFIAVQQMGFGEQNETDPSESDIRQRLARFNSGSTRALLARLHGEPAGVAEFGQPIDGITEITGIATLPKFRRRGIAAWLTAQTLDEAFRAGVQTVCLTAANENAGRVYARAGFTPFSIMLAYIDRI